MTPFLADAIFWIAVVACFVAQIGILRATRATNAARPAVPAASHRSATRVEEIAWAVLPVIALAVALILTWRTLHPHVAVTAPIVGGGTA
jgi:heme/copper-type cytochrome/quinol oxidase subunit 2